MMGPGSFGRSLVDSQVWHLRHCDDSVSFVVVFQMREEKLQEEKASEELIHRLVLDDMDVGKRKTEEQQKKDESVVLKASQECVSKLVLGNPHQRHCLGGEITAEIQSWGKNCFF